jgi:pimeloyl-ACP methyl ester carboxylesterase
VILTGSAVDSQPIAATVLVHALPLDGSMWDDVAERLDGPVLAPTLYGFGATVTQWAAAVLDLAAAGPLVVVGNSVGGSVAIEMAHLAPTRVRRLVLVGAKPGHRPEPALRDEAVQLLTDRGLDAAWERYWAPLFAPDTSPELVDRARRIAAAQPIDALVAGVRAFHARADRSETLRSLRCPVVVARGQYDAIPRDPVAVAAQCRDGCAVTLRNCGHYPPLEQPEALTSLIAWNATSNRPRAPIVSPEHG